MKHFKYNTVNVCSQRIEFDIDNGKVYNIKFDGGCNGNLKAISILLEGSDVDFVINKLKGNLCGRRPTSCADQLAIALEKTKNYECK